MKNKKVRKLAEKKLKKINKWFKKCGDDVDMLYLDGTYDNMNRTKELCEMILNLDKSHQIIKIKKKELKKFKRNLNLV